jgi:hypothetical protein
MDLGSVVALEATDATKSLRAPLAALAAAVVVDISVAAVVVRVAETHIVLQQAAGVAADRLMSSLAP